MPHVVTDIEAWLRHRPEPVVFTCDEQRGDTMESSKDGLERRYRLQLPGGEEIHILKWQDVSYLRLTLREEEEPPDLHLPGGITVSGALPEPPE